MKTAEAEFDVAELDAILAEDMPAEERAVWLKWHRTATDKLAAVRRYANQSPRELVDEWRIPQDTIVQIWGEIEREPYLVARVYAELLDIHLTWPPGARVARADCPFCLEAGDRPGRHKFEVEIASTKCWCWVCGYRSNLQGTLKRRCSLRFRELMKTLGAYVGIIITALA